MKQSITREKILDLIRQHRDEINIRFSVSKIGLFGSYIRNEASAESDIDILVEFTKPTFDNYMDLKFFLDDLFKFPVDLVLEDALKPRIRQYIESEIIYA